MLFIKIILKYYIFLLLEINLDIFDPIKSV